MEAISGWKLLTIERARDGRGREARAAAIVLLGPKLFFVTGLVTFVTAVARLVCPDLIG